MSRMRFTALVAGLLVSLSMPAVVAAQQPKFAYVADFDHFEGFAIDPVTGELGSQVVNDNSLGGATAITTDPSGKFVYIADGLDDLIAAFIVNQSTGALTMVGSPLVAGCPFPDDGDPLPIWSVRVDPQSRFVYALGFGDGTNDGTPCISAYTMNSTTGALTPIAGSPFVTAIDPLSMTIDPTGSFAFVATAEGQISAYKINATTGALTLVAGSPFNNIPNQSGFHDITVSPSGKFLYTTRFTPDSSVLAFAINQTTGALTPAAGSPFAVGDGTVSFAFAPSGQFAYASDVQDLVVRQLSVNSTTGAVAVVSSAGVNVPPPNDFPTFVTVDPSGKFAYTVNVGFSITGFSINQTTGGITIVPGSPFDSTSRETQMVVVDSAPAHCTPNFNVKPLPNTQTGPFNSTSEVCFEVVSTKPLFFNCSQMNARTVTVNGTLFQPAACNSSTGKSVQLPAAASHDYFFDVSAGSPSWASIAFWNQ